jgi:predicted Zn-dependent peptidase
VADVKAFFSHFYVPNNASLTIAGDFDPAEVKRRVTQYFGWIPRGDVPKAPPATPSKLTKIVRDTIPDQVALPKIVMAWQSPARFAKGDAELDLLANILEDGKTSRLYKALVYDKKLAQEVSASQSSRDLGSVFEVEAIARPGVKLEDLEKAIDEELARVRTEPVAPPELTRAKNQFETGFVARLQSVQERASMLNLYEIETGDPGFADEDLARYRKATAADVLATAKATLDPNARVIVYVVPRDQQGAAAPAGKGPGR